jgi:hypothetical protein
MCLLDNLADSADCGGLASSSQAEISFNPGALSKQISNQTVNNNKHSCDHRGGTGSRIL